MNILAIIPARGGSKGIPNKNSLLFDGKTLVDYSIETAIESKLINKIIVSSDDNNILNTASKYSNIILHHRRENLATDQSPVVDTIIDILKKEILDELPWLAL